MKCKKCKGTGYEKSVDSWQEIDLDLYMTLECKECNGSGVIDDPVEDAEDQPINSWIVRKMVEMPFLPLIFIGLLIYYLSKK